jgi:hypothetical protein
MKVLWHSKGPTPYKSKPHGPRQQFCPNMDCPARGKIGKNNIVVHSRKEAHWELPWCPPDVGCKISEKS